MTVRQLSVLGCGSLLALAGAAALAIAAGDRTAASSRFVEVSEFRPDDETSSDGFGRSVAISGRTVVVGEPTASVDGHDWQGAIYVFSKPAAGWASATKVARLVVPDGQAEDYLGGSVAISGSTIVAGATGVDHFKGAVYVFRRVGDEWRLDPAVPRLEASDRDSARGQLGFSVAINGSTMVTGAANARAGAVSAGDVLAGGTADQGAVYVFDIAPGRIKATETAKLEATDGATQSYLGSDVSIDHSTIVAGAPGVSDPGAAFLGAIYVFEPGANGWADAHQVAKLRASDRHVGDELGSAVKVSSDTIVAGAPAAAGPGGTAQGAAYVFAKPAGGWRDITGGVKLVASDGAQSDFFGLTVALAGDRVLVGSAYATVTATPYGHEGAVYVFDQPAAGSGETHESAKFTAADPQKNSFLGRSLAASKATAVVGSWISHSGQPALGAVRIFSDATLTKPIISRLSQTTRRWRPTGSPANPKRAARVPRGTTFRFTLNVPARVRLDISHRSGPRRVRDGQLWVDGDAGGNEVPFDGRLSPTNVLGRGDYRLGIAAKTGAGWSRKKYLTFAVVTGRNS